MRFTRAAMSAARCIKLLHMMGLHRLDDPVAEFEMAPTIAPARDWTELEGERETSERASAPCTNTDTPHTLLLPSN